MIQLKKEEIPAFLRVPQKVVPRQISLFLQYLVYQVSEIQFNKLNHDERLVQRLKL